MSKAKKTRELTLEYIKQNCPTWEWGDDDPGTAQLEALATMAADLKGMETEVFDRKLELLRQVQGIEGVDRLMAWVFGESTYSIHTWQQVARWLEGLDLYPDMPLSTYRVIAEIAQIEFDDSLQAAADEHCDGDISGIPIPIAMELEARCKQLAREAYNYALEHHSSARELRDKYDHEKYKHTTSTVRWIDREAEVLRLDQTGVGDTLVTFRVDEPPSGRKPKRVKLTAREVFSENK